jgi:hypothetical protein
LTNIWFFQARANLLSECLLHQNELRKRYYKKCTQSQFPTLIEVGSRKKLDGKIYHQNILQPIVQKLHVKLRLVFRRFSFENENACLGMHVGTIEFCVRACSNRRIGSWEFSGSNSARRKGSFYIGFRGLGASVFCTGVSQVKIFHCFQVGTNIIFCQWERRGKRSASFNFWLVMPVLLFENAAKSWENFFKKWIYNLSLNSSVHLETNTTFTFKLRWRRDSSVYGLKIYKYSYEFWKLQMELNGQGVNVMFLELFLPKKLVKILAVFTKKQQFTTKK